MIGHRSFSACEDRFDVIECYTIWAESLGLPYSSARGHASMQHVTAVLFPHHPCDVKKPTLHPKSDVEWESSKTAWVSSS